VKQHAKKILVTGGTGFLGRALCVRLNSHGFIVRASVRKEAVGIPEDVEVVRAELSPTFDWSFPLQDIDTLLHVAARVHIMHDRVSDSLKEFRITNVDSTLNLARQAALAGVRRFIFISSIGVNGVATLNKPFSAHDQAAPNSPYAISKHEAELGLQALAHETGMEVVIIRPPIIYGLNSPGNFGSLIRWLGRGLPLPLGAITQNRRSLVGLDNLVDLILTCVDHPKAANQTFLVSDGEDLSTTELLKKMGKAMNRRTRLFPVPFTLLDFVIRLFGKKALAQSLLGSLQVDISYTCRLLDWKPPVAVDEALRRATQQRL
jgi:nucleoside-diphosphate-sugar epimerase